MPDNGSLPAMERVDASRRRPVLVVIGFVILVGLLAWKPWDQPVAPPTLSPVALPTTNPTLVAPTPSPPFDVASIVDMGSTMVRCEYIPRGGGQWLLASLVLVPPQLEPRPDIAGAHVLEVSWRAEVQRNELDSIFSANWEQVDLSDRQFSPAVTSPFLLFQPMRLDYAETPPRAASVLRVKIVVELFGPRRALLGSEDFVVTTYDPGESRPPRIEGCHTVTSA